MRRRSLAPSFREFVCMLGYSPSQIAAHLGHADGGVLALRTYTHPNALDTPEFLDEALSG